ncbi:hypothetical protein NAEGRDRAFT_79011 [Naegleria gruberi]|uniref:Uncharacterized protein n=1 Tax=Naegleria gruberi TaxID=5762 RepID=D2V8K7_NAEGR|nr:uncharacterized protein NAEGRDRAFT_79011 [Naegleria gruberi]EFC46705.1 hypothetical protein NAEGRDRAFT_79011 [Naegleria gruberi]|eukprot:XP_002679449.1 hypothetical protein NAEGRDRAFT_79011 [Naegleria gruberi strain NEG-M]
MSTPTNHDSSTNLTIQVNGDEMSFNPILLGSMSNNNNNEATSLLQPETSDDYNTSTTQQYHDDNNNNNNINNTSSSSSTQVVEGSIIVEGNIMSESKLSEQDKQSLVKELSKAILGIYMNNVIQTSVKDKIIETATDKTTANILSFYYKRREYLKQQQQYQQQQVKQQVEQVEQQVEQVDQVEQQLNRIIEKEEGLISLDHPTNLDDSITRIDLNDEYQPPITENNSSSNNNILNNIPSSLPSTIDISNNDNDIVMIDQSCNDDNSNINNINHQQQSNQLNEHQQLDINHQSNQLNEQQQLDDQQSNQLNEQYDQQSNQLNESIIQLNNEQLNESPIQLNNNQQLNQLNNKDIETDVENEEEEFYKKYMNDFRNDDLIVNKHEELYPCENSYIDHFREAILLEWNEFKKPIEFKYEYIQTRIEQLKKEYNNIIHLINTDTKYSNNNNNELNCSKLSGISNDNIKNNIMINRSSELYNAFYTPYKRRLDLLQHPFFGSFHDVFNREIEHLNQLKEKQSDLTIISSNWVSATSTNTTINNNSILNDTNTNNNTNNTTNNNNNTNNNLKITYPFPYITTLDILDSIELFKTASISYPPNDRAVPLSFSSILKYNNNNSNINRRNVSSSNRRGRRGASRLSQGKRVGNRSSTSSSTATATSGGGGGGSTNKSKLNDLNQDEDYEENFILYDSTKDVKAAEITVPSFRILTNEQVSELSDEFSDDEDISDVKYCYLHIDKEMQERQKYYIASLPSSSDKKKKKTSDQDSKNLHYTIPNHDTFKLAFEKFNSTNTNTNNTNTNNNHSTTTTTHNDHSHRFKYNDDLSTELKSGKNLISMSNNSINNTSITTTFNDKLTYLVPIEDLQQYSSQQQQSTGPMNAKLAFSKHQFQSKLGSPQKKKDLKKELTSIPRWKLISIESYVPYPILKKCDDPRGNWNDLKLKSLERRSNLTLDLNTELTNNLLFNDLNTINTINNNTIDTINTNINNSNSNSNNIIGSSSNISTRKRAKSEVENELITTGSFIKSNSSTTPYHHLQQPKKKSKYDFDDMVMADEDTDEIEDTDDDDFHQEDDEQTDSEDDILISTPKHSNITTITTTTTFNTNTTFNTTAPPSSSNSNNNSTTSITTTTPTKSSSKKSKKKKSTSSKKKKKKQITTPVRVDKVINDGTKIVFKLQK